MRSKKALYNIVSSLSLQFIVVISGLIIPRLIIKTFGSDVNGMIASISQFLSYIVLIEGGVGGVVRSALYKSVAKNDYNQISKTLKSTNSFFKKIAFIFIVYLIIISSTYPSIIANEYDYLFTFSLVMIMGISTLFQYFFGVTYQILLQADQKQYIDTILQIITIIFSTILTILLINLNYSILVVKIGNSILFILRPIILNIYVRKKYKLLQDCEKDDLSIEQRWDGLGHHFSYFVTNNIDIVILTLMSNLKEVSVYSIYFMIISSMRNLTTTFSTGLEAAFGNMIAKNETSTIQSSLELFEIILFSIITILFTCTGILILPFVQIYTSSIIDVNYNRPFFAFIMIIAYTIYCVRIPYSSIILAAGHYKQTKNAAYMEAVINTLSSIILARYFGLIGVALGTLFAMSFRTVIYIVYLSKNILERKIFLTFKKLFYYIVCSSLSIFVIKLFINIIVTTFVSWIQFALITTLVITSLVIVTNLIFYKKELFKILSIFVNALK